MRNLPAYRLADLASAMSCVATPEASGAIDHLAAIGVRVVHALGALQQARAALELTVGSEGHPEMFGGCGVIVGHDCSGKATGSTAML